MTLLRIFLLSLLSFILIGCGDTSTSKVNFTESSLATSVNTTKEEILKVINDARAVSRDCHDGLGIVSAAPALTWNSELYASAYEHSSDLAKSNTFSHYGSGTESDVTGSNNRNASYFNERIEANGYTEYKIIGENIAGGQGSIQEAVDAWIASPAHCTNLMNSSFKEIGVGVAVASDSKYGIYWTQSFGGKK